jgi:hypothetical protein
MLVAFLIKDLVSKQTQSDSNHLVVVTVVLF